ncbi:response regulator [Geodermatophilus sp. CPCC 206100]|uniref:response regulator n=1 Tax=Geodermatophilus sp. CPCC 206100 TaxID=3020054 RepID=UPI003B00DD67
MTNDSVGAKSRVLIVDDQSDVARTLATLLPAERFDVVFAEDGEEGLKRILGGIFDLVIVDLRMPPEQWGGLWLLEQLAVHPGEHAVLVMSGEGGQRETIRAQRLGALDFVVKESAQEELLHRVEECLTTASSRRLSLTPQRLPRPLAVAVSRMDATADLDHQLRAGLQAVEAALRHAALCDLGHRRRLGRLDTSLTARLASPSMGTWNEICRQAGKARDRKVSAWTQIVDVPAAESLIALRNALAHGSQQPRATIQQGLLECRRWLDRYFVAVERRNPPPIKLARALRYEAPIFHVETLSLMGVGHASRVESDPRDQPLEAGHVYLFEEETIDLWPFYVATEGATVGTFELQLWDGYRATVRGVASLGDRTRHTNVDTGERVMGMATVGDIIGPV